MRYSIRDTERGSYGFWDHKKKRWLLDNLSWEDVKEAAYWVNIAEQQNEEMDANERRANDN